ncbi:tyrosine-protein phosphatase [soil metagenome]
MFDIHSHIIPRFDDGVTSEEAAIELLSREAEGGTMAIFATPHVESARDLDASPIILEKVEEVRRLVAEAGIAIEVYSGAELYPSMGIVEALAAGKPITLAGRGKHVLVDLPMGTFPMDFDQVLYEIQSFGVTPILAHPERVGPFQNAPDKLREYVDRGIPCQINSRSLTGRYGKRAQELGFYFLKRRWAHFLASDAHAPGQQPILRAGMDTLEGKIDGDYLRMITVTSGKCVAEGRDLPPLPATPVEEPKRTWIGRLLARNV